MTVDTPAETLRPADTGRGRGHVRAPNVGRRAERALTTVGLLGPAFGLLTVFVLAPLVIVAVLSLFEWDALVGAGDFVGFENFRRVTQSGELQEATLNTAIYMALTVPATVIIGLLIALSINANLRGTAFWRTVYFAPAAATLAAMSVVWRWMFYPDSGVIDSTLGQLIGVTDWLDSRSWALPAVALVGIWQGLGACMVIFLAGLSTVDLALIDAAEMDGAGRWHQFWHVTWPALGPAAVFNAVVATGDALKVFDQVRLMTNGGPVGASETLSFLVWKRGIQFLDVGGGSVVNLVLLALVLVATSLQLLTIGRRWNEAGTR